MISMASKLFILMRSPWECPCCHMDMIQNVKGEDKAGVLLFEDAVYFAASPEMAANLSPLVDEVYALGDDLEARGFNDDLVKGIEMIDYPRAVDLIMEEYDQTITVW